VEARGVVAVHDEVGAALAEIAGPGSGVFENSRFCAYDSSCSGVLYFADFGWALRFVGALRCVCSSTA